MNYLDDEFKPKNPKKTKFQFVRKYGKRISGKKFLEQIIIESRVGGEKKRKVIFLVSYLIYDAWLKLCYDLRLFLC